MYNFIKIPFGNNTTTHRVLSKSGFVPMKSMLIIEYKSQTISMAANMLGLSCLGVSLEVLVRWSNSFITLKVYNLHNTVNKIIFPSPSPCFRR